MEEDKEDIGNREREQIFFFFLRCDRAELGCFLGCFSTLSSSGVKEIGQKKKKKKKQEIKTLRNQQLQRTAMLPQVCSHHDNYIVTPSFESFLRTECLCFEHSTAQVASGFLVPALLFYT